VEHDYLKDGFATKNNAEELYADGLTVSFLRSMIDVTDSIVPKVPLVLSELQRELTIDRAVGNQWWITAGLKAGDQLVVEGGQKVRAGAAVQVQDANAQAPRRPPL